MKKKFFIFILIFPLLFLSACSLKKLNNYGGRKINKPAALEENKKTPNASSVKNTNKSIKSSNLGLEITYYSEENNEIFAKEEGSKIYFWRKLQEQSFGQSIEVFSKDENVSFADAIASQFLNKKSYQDNCFVDIFEEGDNYKKAIINFKSQNPSGECLSGDPSPTCDSCPETYSRKNASDYFIYYKNNPGKYFYISLGQESLIGSEHNLWYGSDDSREWFNNIKFINNETVDNNRNIPGGDRDEHGCIGSAGYTWCEAKQKCLRLWEEQCND